MVHLSGLLVILLASSAISEDALLTPCEIQDTECLSKTTQEFLEKTSKGIPEYDIRQIEPLFIPTIDYILFEDPIVEMHLRNITVKGLKDQKFSDFKMNTEKKFVHLQTKVNIDSESNLTIELENKKSFSGAYSIKGAVLGTAKYGYDFKTDDKGVLHFEVGPEVITCQAVGETKVSALPELKDSLKEDPDFQAVIQKFSPKVAEIYGKQLCEIVKVAFVTLVHNIRASAKILPANAFLKGF